MKRKVLRLSESFNEIKGLNLTLTEATSKELFEDPLKSVEQSKRWKIKSAYGDIGLKCRDDETVACRMPAVYSDCYRVLCEVCKRLLGFSPAKVLDFGVGTGHREGFGHSLWNKVNIMEPSQSMQRAESRKAEARKSKYADEEMSKDLVSQKWCTYSRSLPS